MAVRTRSASEGWQRVAVKTAVVQRLGCNGGVARAAHAEAWQSCGGTVAVVWLRRCSCRGMVAYAEEDDLEGVGELRLEIEANELRLMEARAREVGKERGHRG